MANGNSFNIKIETRQVGAGWVAMTQLGGIPVRGKWVAAGDQAELLATRNLLWKLAGEGTEDEPLLALELAMAGTTLESEFRGEQAESRPALPPIEHSSDKDVVQPEPMPRDWSVGPF